MYTHLVDLVIFKEQKRVRQLMRYVVVVRACNCSINTSCSGLSLIVGFYHSSIFIVINVIILEILTTIVPIILFIFSHIHILLKLLFFGFFSLGHFIWLGKIG